MIEKTSEKKGVSRTIAVALVILNIILLGSLVGVMVNYTSVVNGKDSTIAAKNAQIASLDSQILNLQNQVSEISSTLNQPVQFSGSLEIGSGTLANGRTYFFMVPNETRLVIEYVSARVYNLDPSDSIDLHISTTINGVQVTHYLGVASPQGRHKIDAFSQAYQFLSQEVRIYADAGSNIGVGGNRLTRINNVIVVFSVSGYFVDVN